MITRRDMAFGHEGATALQLGARKSRTQVHRMLGLAFAGLIVVTLGVASQAQSAQASADLTRAHELAVAQVGDRIGIGAAGVDVNGIRDAAAASFATSAVHGAQGLISEAGAELGADAAATLVSLRNGVIAEVASGGSAAAVTTAVASLRAEHGALSAALTAHREAVAAQLAAQVAAEAAAAEAARVAAEQSDDIGSWSESSDAESGSDVGTSSGSAGGVPAAAAANPYTAEFYPGLPAAPRDEDCGPCTGKEMHPVYYNGKYVWGCNA